MYNRYMYRTELYYTYTYILQYTDICIKNVCIISTCVMHKYLSWNMFESLYKWPMAKTAKLEESTCMYMEHFKSHRENIFGEDIKVF